LAEVQEDFVVGEERGLGGFDLIVFVSKTDAGWRYKRVLDCFGGIVWSGKDEMRMWAVCHVIGMVIRRM